MRSTKKNVWKPVIWVAGLFLIGFILFRAFQPSPVLVDVATVARGPLQVTVDDDGQTRVKERYTITAPIQGRLLRITLDPGDSVQANDTVVAEFAPVPPNFLDARSRAEAIARLARAEASVKERTARREQAAAEVALAAAELKRVRNLVLAHSVPKAELDVAERNERSEAEGLRAAEFAVQVARFEQQLARASLGEPTEKEIKDTEQKENHSEGAELNSPSRLRLRSPINGHVIRVHEESARSLTAGSPIIEVGNTTHLEIVADYLTTDAVKVRPGMRAQIVGWGGKLETGQESVLKGRVRVVEPGGFTKVSALGVEEQRVNVIVDPIGDAKAWAALGDGYRVELRILLWEDDNTMLVPTGALFREGDSWAVLVVETGIARLRTVEVGKRSTHLAQVTTGLYLGEQIILYPSELIRDGTPVKTR